MMHRPVARVGLFLFSVVVSACGEGGSPPPPPEANSGQAGAAAQAPGGMCREHGVLEAVCTLCNPALVPIFKAKGDWCEEHGLPESFCPTCHPDRGGQPSADVSGEVEVADGTIVRFKSMETARLAGIEVAQVAERNDAAHLVVTARIVNDATKVAEVNARSAGVIRKIHVDVGARVHAGTPLATIESAGVGADRSRLQAARSRVEIAEANYSRLKTLHEEGIAAEKDALAARQEWESAQAELSSVQAALGVVGSDADGASLYEVTAPIAGVVTQRDATMGRLVDSEKVLFEIVDVSLMWAELDIPEANVNDIAAGQRVTLTVDGLGEREFSGTLSFISPQIDPYTRTAKGRVALENSDGALRGNMFARARVALRGADRAVVVPREAVQRAPGAQLVFVRMTDDSYEARRVRLGPAEADLVQVSGRLEPGDFVVTTGSFLLKTETLKGSIGAGCCEVEEVN